MRRGQSVDASVQATVQLIPRLGGVKAKALVQKFGSIEAIARASPEVTFFANFTAMNKPHRGAGTREGPLVSCKVGS